MADIATWQHLPHITQIINSTFAPKLIKSNKDEKSIVFWYSTNQ